MTSALEESKNKHADLSYYHAHKPTEDLSEVRVIEGKGLANSSGNVKLQPGDEGYVDPINEDKIEYIKTHMFADEGSKVKVYIEVEPEIMRTAKVEVEFEEKGAEVRLDHDGRTIMWTSGDREFAEKIIPGTSSWRINSGRNKLILSMPKLGGEETGKWNELFKKEINKHTGWQ